MKKYLFILSSILIFTSITQAQDDASVLFIGNSYTYYNDMPDILSDIAASLGNSVNNVSQTTGGATFSGHVGNTNTFNAINSQIWDYVVLQGQSQDPRAASCANRVKTTIV